jgi:hypothetical protein
MSGVDIGLSAMLCQGKVQRIKQGEKGKRGKGERGDD